MTTVTKEDKELFIAVSGSEYYAEDILVGNCFTWEVDAIAKYREQASLDEREMILTFMKTYPDMPAHIMSVLIAHGHHRHEK